MSQKTSHFYILNNSVENELIVIILGVKNLQKISHQNIVNLSTSP